MKLKLKDIINYNHLTLFSVGLIFLSAIMFMGGYHNIDLGYNMNTINYETNNNYQDIGSDGVIRSGSELYMLGLDQIYSAFVLLFGSAIMFGICLGGYSR